MTDMGHVFVGARYGFFFLSFSFGCSMLLVGS